MLLPQPTAITFMRCADPLPALAGRKRGAPNSPPPHTERPSASPIYCGAGVNGPAGVTNQPDRYPLGPN